MFNYPTSIKLQELGSVYLEPIKCGKSNCHCYNGRPHKGYYQYYRQKDEFGIVKLIKKYINRSDVRKIKAWIQYQKNKIYIIKLDGGWFQYSGENIPLVPPMTELLKRIHVIRKKAIKEKKRLDEQIYRQMYGENYREGQLAEKRLSRILNKKNILPELFSVEVDKLTQEIQSYTKTLPSNLPFSH